jgi:hypothetical protein
MTEQTEAPPALPTDNVKPESKWRWLKVTVGTIAAGFLAIALLGSYNPVDLELTRRDLFDAAHDGKVLDITNAGTKPIKLIAITINNRPDCRIYRLSFVDNSALFPSTLKIGDQLTLAGSCQIVRATVETDLGSNTYTFNR